MVNIIENKAQIEGTVQAISSQPDPSGFLIAEICLNATHDVEPLANLARADEGKTIRVKVKPAQLTKHKLQPGASISCAVRKVFGQVYFLAGD